LVPPGLLYMLLKHMVDRYNIYYVYIPTKLNQRLHVAAISQVVVAPILCMFWLLFFSVLRLGPTRPVTLFTFVVLLSCIVFSFFGLCLKKLQPRKPSSYQMSDQSEGAFNDVERSSVSSTPNSNLFVATVLQEPELSLTPAASPAHQSYGTMGNHLEPAEDGEDGGLQSFETELETVEGEYRSGPVIESQARYQ
ncbi:CSC1 protein, partial [Buphagus erythrorhynchus]|nr:CSC1 protein [Buphagus erythrorhynchus]